MSKVLVAFDGSETAKTAVLKTLKIVKPSRVFVLYVIDENDIRWPSRIDISVIWGDSLRELEENILELHKRHAKKVLEKAKKLIGNKAKAKFISEIGDPAEVILKKAEELKCNLIVVGSKSRTQFEFLLGSVAEKVAARSKIPVLIVKPDKIRK